MHEEDHAQREGCWYTSGLEAFREVDPEVLFYLFRVVALLTSPGTQS